MNNFLLLVSGFLFSSEFIFTKLFEKYKGSTYKETVNFVFLTGLIMFLLLFAVNGFKIEFSLVSVLYAFLLALLNVIANIVSIKAVPIGSLVVLTLFMMSGGTVVPFMVGIFFLNEQINLASALALFLLMFALFLPLFKKKDKAENKINTLFIILCILTFALNGANATVGKLHQINPNSVDTIDMLTIKYMFRTIFGLLMLFTVTSKNQVKDLFEKKSIGCSAGYAIVHAVATVLQLFCAVTENATLIYPLITGGTLIFTPLLTLIIFKEKLDKCTIWQIVVSVVATTLFVI